MPPAALKPESRLGLTFAQLWAMAAFIFASFGSMLGAAVYYTYKGTLYANRIDSRLSAIETALADGQQKNFTWSDAREYAAKVDAANRHINLVVPTPEPNRLR